MKKLASLALCLAMLLTLTVSALAAGAPNTPPAWVKAEEYAVFQDGKAYEPTVWNQILALRNDAAAGHREPKSGEPLYADYTALKNAKESSIRFEIGLIALKYACNAAAAGETVTRISHSFELAGYYSQGDEPARYVAYLWNARCKLVSMESTTDVIKQGTFRAAMQSLLAYDQFTMDSLLQGEWMQLVPAEKERIARNMLFVTLDGYVVHPREVYTPTGTDATTAYVRNGRTMVPVRRLAELMGATVSYANGKVTMTRAADTIVMTIGSKTATINGKPLEMDVSPYIENGRTYIPVRFMAEFFGQSVEWLGEKQQVRIQENRAAVKPSNLEAWALPMGAMLTYMNHKDHYKDEPLFGGNPRFGARPVGSGVSNAYDTTGPDYGREILNGGSWGILDRKDLIETVYAMTYHGHNDSFLEDVAWINSMTSAEYQTIVSSSTGMDAYMFPYTKQLGQKWGSKGILAWDLFRMSNLVQWGYLAGYVTYAEALALLEPAASLLHDNFTSWDEAYENYLDGYNWWARNDVLNQNVWETERGVYYQEMKAHSGLKTMFDNTLFRTPVIGVPGLTAEQLLASVQ